ncbi:MAG: flavin reductase family protein [Lachnospiraceae bacterium]
MNTFHEVNAKEFNQSPFKLIGSEWMLITAEKDGKVNTMTASWGGVGVMWATDVAYAVIRQSRYTKEFIDAADSFSLSFLDHQTYAKELGYLGSVSGRDEDKIAKMNLHVGHEGDVPYIAEASKVIICKKMFAQTMKPENFVDMEIGAKFYGDKDYHEMYIGGIEKIMVCDGV